MLPSLPPSPWLGTWSRPPDYPSEAALAVAVTLLAVALIPGAPRRLAALLDFAGISDLARPRRFLAVSSLAAAFLSLGYIAFYLRGGPRAPEAATYWLQGRALSHGSLAWTVAGPTASFRAKDLLFSPPDRLSGIFAPGFPLMLAAGFLVGAPMLIGPLLGAALVVATWALGHELANGAGIDGPRAEGVARIAAGLSVVSVGLRHCTADALPDGAAALAITVALACALRARRAEGPRWFGAVGLAMGTLCATRPASAIPAGAIVLAVAFGAPQRWRAVAWTVAGAIPGAILLLAANQAATGRYLAWPEAAYLARIAPSAAAWASMSSAAVSALRGLGAHMEDIAGFEPLALLVVVPLVGKTRSRIAAPAALIIAGQLVMNAMRVARGGAPLLADVLPIEHALIALALVRAFPVDFATASTAMLGMALGGYAVHASYDHERLAASDVGRPRFEPDVPREAGITSGLLFFADDEGYELAHDPGALATHGVLAVRLLGDDHDRLLEDTLGHPVAHRYAEPGASAASASAAFWTPPGSGDPWRFEAENEWPPAGAGGGWGEVVDVPGSCASDGRALALVPAGAWRASLTIELPVPRGPTPPERRKWDVVPRVLQRGGVGAATLALVASPEAGPAAGVPIAQWSWKDAGTSRGKGPACVDLPSQTIELGGERVRAWLVLTADGGPVTLDRTILRTNPGPR